MKPTVVVYGNCQAAVLASCFQFMGDISSNYEVVYYRSFVHPTEGAAIVDPEVISRCKILWNQIDEGTPFPQLASLPQDCRTVTFPPVDIGLLWPFQAHDPVFGPEPDYEYGMFPYGDRVLMETSDAGLLGAEGLQHATALEEKKTRDIERHVDIEFSRLMRREQDAMVRIAPFVLSNFKVKRLFWSYNHPASPLLAEILNRLIGATWPESRKPEHPLHLAGSRIFAEWEPLADLQVPVGETVAQRLNLTWWEPSQKYKFHGDRELTPEEYRLLYLNERASRLQKTGGTV
ncbi:WcbI family polysaccharide biosynthesis putative acetyltransferase [Brevundimonas sp.]|uniref:WcbI family polysaccharide biosynthesis putative acetyltransferase n=1 Tax=Brevundimonas sp. TaxID=1871086 RepID=UPI00289E7E15|nr:WcbI family polysaccharide biosynthesis putative acetyltransferase [Brevundimonas sp.]